MKRKQVNADMTNLLKVPSPYADDYLVNLADWVEVKALLESDGNASREDLSRALKREYSIGDSTAEDMAGDVFKGTSRQGTFVLTSHRRRKRLGISFCSERFR